MVEDRRRALSALETQGIEEGPLPVSGRMALHLLQWGCGVSCGEDGMIADIFSTSGGWTVADEGRRLRAYQGNV